MYGACGEGAEGAELADHGLLLVEEAYYICVYIYIYTHVYIP